MDRRVEKQIERVCKVDTMTLYKTIRCRYFDDSGHALKPHCSQGARCRFIHPSDPQWKGGKEGLLSSSFETYKGSKYRHSSSVSLPYRRQPSSPMMQLGDSSRRKHDDGERDRECSQRDRRKHEFEYRGRFTQERGATLKGTSDRRSYAYHCSRTESKQGKSVSKTESTKQGGTKQDTRTDNMQRTTDSLDIGKGHLSTTENMSDLFRSLTKLCTEVVQDAHILSREEDKLKAFTDLSAELSQLSSDSAMTVAPTLAAVITSHRECKEKAEQHAQELETLWKSLFAALEREMVKIVETRLNAAVTTLQKEGKNISHSVERSRSSIDNTIPATKRRRIETSEVNANQESGEGLKELLQAMKSQMDKQTKAIERLSKDKQQEVNDIPAKGHPLEDVVWSSGHEVSWKS